MSHLLSIRSVGTLLLILILAAFMGGCVVLDPHDDYDKNHSVSESFNFDVDVNNRDTFRIRGISGKIEISGSTTTTVEIWGEKTVRADSYSDAESHLDDLRVRIDSDADEVFVWTDQPRNDNRRDYEVTYHVRIPRDWQVRAENTNGEIDVDSVDNNIIGGVTNGDFNMLGIKGDVIVGVTNGTIELYDVEGSMECGVTNGRIVGDFVLPLGGACILGVTNGDIDISIPENTSAAFTARITNGGIGVSGLALTNLTTSEHSTSGILGSGDGTMTLTVTNGQIRVRGY